MVKPPRRTHAEGRAATRRALLDAAADLFAAKGFSATSLDQIASRAGLTRGALHYNFDGKADLLLTLMEDRIAARGAALEEPGTHDFAPALGFDRQASLLFLEFAAAAARDEELGKRLLARLGAARAANVEQVGAVLSRAGVDPGRAAELIDLVGAFANGLSIEALAGADVDELDRRFAVFTKLLIDGARVREA